MSASRGASWWPGPALAKRLREEPPPAPEIGRTVDNILARKREFGITRLGSLTGLDRIGIPVVQVIRPLSLSVTVHQGKGLTFDQASISALMESLECWAAERVAPERQRDAPFSREDQGGLWSHIWMNLPPGEMVRSITWIDAWDLLSETSAAVPLALVDTAYVVPSPHPQWFKRNTTGLAAGTSVHQAAAHASFEILERHARYLAMKTPHFFDRNQVRTSSVNGRPGDIILSLRNSGFEVGIWSIPTGHGLPVFWCQIMEGADLVPLAPLPAEGFGCDVLPGEALTKALLEACQSRLGAISSAREDVTVDFYRNIDHQKLSSWRSSLSRGQNAYVGSEISTISAVGRLKIALGGIKGIGARAALATVLFADDSIPAYVIRIVAPPLHSNPEAADDD